MSELKERKINALKIKKHYLQAQAYTIDKIIQSICNKQYYNASIQIRFNLNDNNFSWYKPIEKIIDNQISNLFYDIEHNTNLTYEFFNNQYEKLFFKIGLLNEKLEELEKE